MRCCGKIGVELQGANGLVTEFTGQVLSVESLGAKRVASCAEDAIAAGKAVCGTNLKKDGPAVPAC